MSGPTPTTAMRRRPACFISTGSVLIDLPLHVDHVPVSGGAVTAVSSGPAVGGGYTVVSAVARQGLPAALAATLGTGPNSSQVRQAMMLDGVELVVEELVGDIGTCTTLIEPSGRRSFITTEGVEAEPQIEDLEHLELVGGDWVYATGYDLVHPSSSAVLSAWLLRLPQDVGLIVDLGPVQAEVGDDLLRAVLARSTLLTGNHLEMTGLIERLGSPGALRSAAPRALIVRRTGVHGCELWTVEGEHIEVPGFARGVVDTTGAGDTHTGVLVAGLMDGLDVVTAARRANAAGFIGKLTDGFDTEIGERGIKLSGGQKQRISVARALLKDAPILILDEATSALDTKAERAVQAGLDELMEGRTTLIIAHRLSTISTVDRIVTLRDGRIDEIGSPAELAASGGIYAELLALQGSTRKADKAKLLRYDITH